MAVQPNENGVPRGQVALALLIGVIAISFSAIFFRKAAPTHPLVSSLIRLTFASVLLLPMAARVWRLSGFPRPVFLAGLRAGVFYSVHFGAWVTSLTLTSVASSVTLVTATPLLLGIVGVVTGRDSPSRTLWVSLGAAFVGLLFIGGADLVAGQGALLGDALALLGAAAMAGYLLIGRGLGTRMEVWTFGLAAVSSGALILLVVALALSLPLLPVSWESAGWLALAALFPQLVGHTLLTWSLRHTSPTAVGLATVGEPVGSTALGWLILGESTTGMVAIGCVIILSAVVWSFRR